MRIRTPQNSAFSSSGPINPAQVAAVFDTTITVNANAATGYVTFWTPTSTNFIGGAYYLMMYAEIFNTTINVGTALNDFTLKWTSSGAPATTNLAIANLDVASSQINYGPFEIDNGQPVQWKYTVTGYAAGVGTLRLKASFLRFC